MRGKKVPVRVSRIRTIFFPRGKVRFRVRVCVILMELGLVLGLGNDIPRGKKMDQMDNLTGTFFPLIISSPRGKKRLNLGNFSPGKIWPRREAEKRRTQVFKRAAVSAF